MTGPTLVSFLNPGEAPIDRRAVEAWLRSFPRRLDTSDVTHRPRVAAEIWVRGYTGSDDYLRAMAARSARAGLTRTQARGVLNKWRHQLNTGAVR